MVQKREGARLVLDDRNKGPKNLLEGGPNRKEHKGRRNREKGYYEKVEP